MRNTGQSGPTWRSLPLLVPSGKRIQNRWGFPAQLTPLLGRKVGGGQGHEHAVPRCSNSSPRARLNFSPRVIKHIGFSGLPHLALGGLGTQPPSTGLGRELLPQPSSGDFHVFPQLLLPAPGSLSHPCGYLTKWESDPQQA